MKDVAHEWRVTWKREGLFPASALRQTEKGANRRVEQLRWVDAQPKTVWNSEIGSEVPNAPTCLVPKLEWVRVERRAVASWETLLDESHAIRKEQNR